LRSDVAIGTSLSGGLDSSSIVATISQHLDNPLCNQKCFSAVFPGFEKDESKFMAEVVKQFKVAHFAITPTAAGFETSLQQLMYHQEEPLQSASAFAQWEVYKLAKSHHVTVLLDGQGADETLAGYKKYYHWYWQQLFDEGQKKILAIERNATKELGIAVPWGIKNILAARFPNFAAMQLSKKAIKQQLKNPFITKDFLTGFQQQESLQKPVVTKLGDILQYDTFTRGLGDLLRYADRNSMAHGCEVRLPFLNHELVEFIFSLPPGMKIKNGWTKWILRKSMAASLPANITWRKDKIGYEPPQQQWMQQPMIVEQMMEARKKLVAKKILQAKVLGSPIIASAAHEADNFDWRCLCVANMR
jgi:asparagine synthase (glutamine-hydrolysing)